MSESIDYTDGQHVEKLVEACLQAGKWYTTPTRAHRPALDSAPLLQGGTDGIVEPDVLAIGGGDMVWCEAKKKNDGSNYCIVRSQDEHGIEKRLWDDYKNLEIQSGAPLFLFVFEVPTGLLLTGRITELSRFPPIDEERCKSHYGELISYAPRDEFTKLNVPKQAIPDSFPHQIKHDPDDGVDLSTVVDYSMNFKNNG